MIELWNSNKNAVTSTKNDRHYSYFWYQRILSIRISTLMRYWKWDIFTARNDVVFLLSTSTAEMPSVPPTTISLTHLEDSSIHESECLRVLKEENCIWIIMCTVHEDNFLKSIILVWAPKKECGINLYSFKYLNTHRSFQVTTAHWAA